MRLNNLCAEMTRRQIGTQEIADTIDKTYDTVRKKIKRSNFKVPEAIKIRKELFPDLDLEYLFGSEDGHESAKTR